ncbi:hypothetical protein CSUI_009167 [Cystoisospora suis]|uniref:CS domain-containing protein n=1 Tax=Cystoisospora suis TaxID=483139 RepID=A0A2C6KKX3_9APIC|nr:hypothetical protein CSUI_009167 [Cystoisospora suis]
MSTSIPIDLGKEEQSLLPSFKWDEDDSHVSLTIGFSNLLQSRTKEDVDDIISKTSVDISQEDEKTLSITSSSPSFVYSFILELAGGVKRTDSLQVKKEGTSILLTLEKKSSGLWKDISSKPLKVTKDIKRNEKKEDEFSSLASVDECSFLAKERNVGSKNIVVPSFSRPPTKTANKYFTSIHKEDIKRKTEEPIPEGDEEGEEDHITSHEDQNSSSTSSSSNTMNIVLEQVSPEDCRPLSFSEIPELSKENLSVAAAFFKPKKNDGSKEKEEETKKTEELSLTSAQRMLTLIEIWNASSKEERLEFLKRLIETTKEKLRSGGGEEEEEQGGGEEAKKRKQRKANCLLSVDELSAFLASDEKKKGQLDGQRKEEDEGDCLGDIDASSQYTAQGVTYCSRWISDLKTFPSLKDKADCLQALIEQLGSDEIEVILSTFV